MSWADKYRPERMSELIISDRILDQITNWIDLWKAGTPVKKALVLYGPPGSGKTTTAHVIAKEMGWPIVEMNASEQRNRDSIRRIALMASLYGDLSFVQNDPESSINKLILIDEADNIFEGRRRDSGGDSGGMSELSRVIKGTKNPIILTMNEFYEFKRKNYGKDILENAVQIEFQQYKRRNDVEHRQFRLKLTRRINEILAKENLRLKPDILTDVIDRNANDIRGIINDIESLRFLSSEKVGAAYELSRRDSKENIYNIISGTFKSRNYNEILRSLYNKDFTTEDYLMWIDHNLPAEAKEPEDLMRAYDILSKADLYIGRVIRKQHYALKMYSEEIAAGVYTGIKNRNEHYVKYQFPSFIMSSSKMKEARNTRKSILYKIGRANHMSVRKVRGSMWFYGILASADEKFSDYLEDKLQFSEKEMSMLKKKGKR